MKKIISSFVFVGILGSVSLSAEENGWFVGTQYGGGGVELEYEYCKISSANSLSPELPYEVKTSHYTDSQGFKGAKYGFLGGYKHFFTADFGLRYYATFNVGKYDYEDTAYKIDNPNEIRASFKNRLNEYAFNLNVDILYNLVNGESSNFGIFGGVSLGYVWYRYDIQEGIDAEYREQGYRQIDKARNFDAGLNFGLRVNIINKHSIEIYSRFALLKQKETYAVVAPGRIELELPNQDYLHYKPLTLTNAPMRNIGVRYIFAF